MSNDSMSNNYYIFNEFIVLFLGTYSFVNDIGKHLSSKQSEVSQIVSRLCVTSDDKSGTWCVKTPRLLKLTGIEIATFHHNAP